MIFFRVSVCQEFVRTTPPKLLNRFQRDFACIIIGWGSCAPGVTFDLDLLFKVIVAGPWLIFMYTFGTKHKLDYAIAGVFITFSDSSSLNYN